MRVVIADDTMLVRSGLSLLLAGQGVDVVGEAAEADELLRLVTLERPDIAIIDIRMPPTHTDEGLVAAERIRSGHDGVGVLVLSQYLELDYAQRLLTDQPSGVGYLLKERVADIAVLIDALNRIQQHECVIDPAIVSRVMKAQRPGSAMARLTPREREILGLMAEGRSNAGIASQLVVSERTVEALCAQVFRKLGLEASRNDNRRVLAVLAALSE